MKTIQLSENSPGHPKKIYYWEHNEEPLERNDYKRNPFQILGSHNCARNPPRIDHIHTLVHTVGSQESSGGFFGVKRHVYQSWALALFFQVRSPLIFYPWIAIALLLILPIFRFANRSIILKKTSGSLLKRVLKRSIAPKTTVVRSF